MSELDELIQKLCPDGVEFLPLWKCVDFDKRFNGVEKHKQEKVLTFSHVSAEQLKKMECGGKVKLLSTGKFEGYTTKEVADEFLNEGEVISFPSGGSATLKYYYGYFVDSGNILCQSANTKKYNLKFIYHYLLKNIILIESYYRGSGVKHPEMSKIIKIKIPVPPLEVQDKIVRILDNFTELTAELTAEFTVRKQQCDYYRNTLLDPKRNNYKKYYLKEIGKVKMCKRIMKNQTTSEGDVPFYKIGTFGKKADSYISYELFEEYKNKFSYPKKGDILISCSGTIGRTVVFDGEDAYFQDSNIVWLENDEKIVLNKFLFYAYQLMPFKISTGGTISRLYISGIEEAVIFVPSLEEQQKIVDILDKFDTYCNDLTQGLPAEIELRKQQYEYYRDKLLSFKELK